MQYLFTAVAAVLVALITSLLAGRYTTRTTESNNESEEERLSFSSVVRGLEHRVESLEQEVKACHTEKDEIGQQIAAMEVSNQGLRMEIIYLRRRVKELEP